MSFLKKIFKKKEESNIKGREADALQKWTEYFESCDESQITKLKKSLKELKRHPSKTTEIIHEFIGSGIEYRGTWGRR